jgi:hypothetical protein
LSISPAGVHCVSRRPCAAQRQAAESQWEPGVGPFSLSSLRARESGRQKPAANQRGLVAARSTDLRSALDRPKLLSFPTACTFPAVSSRELAKPGPSSRPQQCRAPTARDQSLLGLPFAVCQLGHHRNYGCPFDHGRQPPPKALTHQRPRMKFAADCCRGLARGAGIQMRTYQMPYDVQITQNAECAGT